MIQHLFITLLGRFSLATIVMEDAPNALKLLRATKEEALMNYSTDASLVASSFNVRMLS
jgi:hypothetical protein